MEGPACPARLPGIVRQHHRARGAPHCGQGAGAKRVPCRWGPRQMHGDTCFLKAWWAGVCRAGGKGLPRAGPEQGRGTGAARGTAAPSAPLGRGPAWGGGSTAPGEGCAVPAGCHSPAQGPAVRVNPGATARASQPRGERMPPCSRRPHVCVAPQAPSRRRSGLSPTQPHRAPRSRASASPHSHLIWSILLAFPFPPGKPTQPLRLFSARCPGCGPEREVGAGLGAAGPLPQAAARPRDHVAGTAAGDPEGGQLLPRLGASRGAGGRWRAGDGGDAAGSRTLPTRHGAWCGDRDPQPVPMSDVGDPWLSLQLQPLRGTPACRAGVQPMSPTSVCPESPSIPVGPGCPIPIRASSGPSRSSSCPGPPGRAEPPGRTETGRLGHRRSAGTGGPGRACVAQSLPELV